MEEEEESVVGAAVTACEEKVAREERVEGVR